MWALKWCKNAVAISEDLNPIFSHVPKGQISKDIFLLSIRTESWKERWYRFWMLQLNKLVRITSTGITILSVTIRIWRKPENRDCFLIFKHSWNIFWLFISQQTDGFACRQKINQNVDKYSCQRSSSYRQKKNRNTIKGLPKSDLKNQSIAAQLGCCSVTEFLGYYSSELGLPSLHCIGATCP